MTSSLSNIHVVHVKSFGTKSKMIKDGELYVYCGRPSRLGNPFVMHDEKERESVIGKFEQNLPSQDILELHQYCKSKNVKTLHLGCYCAPKACHCDVIKKELLRIDGQGALTPVKEQKYYILKPKSFLFSNLAALEYNKKIWSCDDLIAGIKSIVNRPQYKDKELHSLARKEGKAIDLLSSAHPGVLFSVETTKHNLTSRRIMDCGIDMEFSIDMSKSGGKQEDCTFSDTPDIQATQKKKGSGNAQKSVLSMSEIEKKYAPAHEELYEMRYNGLGMTMHQIARVLKEEMDIDAKVVELGQWFRAH